MPETKLWSTISASLSSAQSTTFVAGATAGYFAGREILHDLMRSPTEYSQVLTGFPGAPEILATLTPIAAGMAAASIASTMINTTGAHAESIESIAERRTTDKDFTYKLPPWPARAGALSLTLGEYHGGDPNKITYSETPGWYTIPETGLYGNIITLGGIGGGKSAGIMYPLADQMLEQNAQDPERKCGMLVLDVKGDFVADITAIARKYDRDDILLISPGGDQYWNPIHDPEAPPEVLAGRLMAVIENLSGNSNSGDGWVLDGAQKCLIHGIGMHRLAYGYITIKDLNTLIANIGGEKMIGPDGQLADPALDYLEENYLNVFFSRETTPDQEADFAYHYEYFKGEWCSEPAKSKAYYSSTITTVTALFSKPSNAKTFCAPEDQLNFKGFGKLIDEGWIVALDATEATHGVFASALGVLMKLEFQRAALTRVSRAKHDSSVNTVRPLAMIIDEYQNFVTVSGKRVKDGDDGFYALSRQSKCVSILATQTPASLISKIGREKTNVILASIRTKIIMALLDKDDTATAAEWAGKDWTTVTSRSISANSGKAGFNPLTGKIDGSAQGQGEGISIQQQMLHRVHSKTINELRSFEAIVLGWDGFQAQPPARVYMKTLFVPEPLQGSYSDPRNLPAKKLFEFMGERTGV
jgi:hypothetical protein